MKAKKNFGPIFSMIFSVILFLGSNSLVWAEEQIYVKGPGCDDSRIKRSPKMLEALRQLKKVIGRTPQLRSCYRSAASQRRVAKKYPGRVSKKISQHTAGVAVDLMIGGGNKSICDALDSVRKKIGHGGIGTYGDGSGHFDIRPGYASWAGCGRYASTDYISPEVEEYLKTASAENPNHG